jgi:hypothetical protein
MSNYEKMTPVKIKVIFGIFNCEYWQIGRIKKYKKEEYQHNCGYFISNESSSYVGIRQADPNVGKYKKFQFFTLFETIRQVTNIILSQSLLLLSFRPGIHLDNCFFSHSTSALSHSTKHTGSKISNMSGPETIRASRLSYVVNLARINWRTCKYAAHMVQTTNAFHYWLATNQSISTAACYPC